MDIREVVYIKDFATTCSGSNERGRVQIHNCDESLGIQQSVSAKPRHFIPDASGAWQVLKESCQGHS